MRRRVVITGLGVLSCAGDDLEEFRQNLVRGVCCLARIEDPHAAPLRSRYAGLLRRTSAAKLQLASDGEGSDRFVPMALVAAREALAAARVQPAEWDGRMGLIFATCSGPMLLIEEHYERILGGDPRLTARQLLAKRYYSGARVLARTLGVRGFSTTVVTACSASTAAIALAADLIRCGMLDAALAGGSDAFATSTLAGFEGLKATCDDKCAPFSKPFGLNLGEAAGFVFLEIPETAAARAVPPHAELLGSGMSNDAYHCSAPEPTGRGLASAMKRALADAGLAPDQITYINAHGTGTEANDKAETKSIRKVFGPGAERLPVSSTKSMVGHCLGAAGAVEAIASIVCAQSGVMPPTANFTEARDGCALDCVPDAGRPWPGPRVFLSNNSAFGGHNASLVIKVRERGGDGDSLEKADGAARSHDSVLSHLGSPGHGQDKGEHDVRFGRAFVGPVCVTACGLISSLGVGGAAIHQAIAEGRQGISLRSIPGLPPLPSGLVNEAEVEKFDRRLDLRGMDSSSRWATVATRLAIREARFPEKPSTLAELGLFLHLAAGPSGAEEEFLTSFLGHHHQVRQIAVFPSIVPSSVAGNVCRALMLTGHNLTLSAGPGAGLLGLVPAVAALRSGQAAAILSGAVDELSDRILTDRHMAGLASAQGASPPGEGAAILMLETPAHAQARGVKSLAVLCSLACVADTPQADSADGSREAQEGILRAVLQQAGITPEEVTAVCVDAPRARLEKMAARICPGWLDRRMSVAGMTGHMEGAQILADLAAAWRAPYTADSPRYVLGLVSSQGLTCAAVFCTKKD